MFNHLIKEPWFIVELANRAKYMQNIDWNLDRSRYRAAMSYTWCLYRMALIMVFILDGISEHAARECRKIGLYGENLLQVSN